MKCWDENSDVLIEFLHIFANFGTKYSLREFYYFSTTRFPVSGGANFHPFTLPTQLLSVRNLGERKTFISFQCGIENLSTTELHGFTSYQFSMQF